MDIVFTMLFLWASLLVGRSAHSLEGFIAFIVVLIIWVAYEVIAEGIYERKIFG